MLRNLFLVVPFLLLVNVDSAVALPKWLYWLAFVLILGGVVLPTTPVVADITVGIVLEATGKTEPEVTAYSTLKHKESITLGPGASLRFNHRHTCHRVTVVGEGTLTVRAGSYHFTGETSEQVKAKCQKALIYIDPHMESGGSATRGAITTTILRTGKPQLIVSGYDTAHFYKVEFRLIKSEDVAVGRVDEAHGDVSVTHSKENSGKALGVIASIDLAGPRTKWPESKASLESGSTYKVILAKDGKTSKFAETIIIDYSAEPLASQHFLLMDFGDAALK